MPSFPWLQVKELKGEEKEEENEEENEEEEEEVEGSLGFDDPFFQHDVAMATTVSGISSHAKLIIVLSFQMWFSITLNGCNGLDVPAS